MLGRIVVLLLLLGTHSIAQNTGITKYDQSNQKIFELLADNVHSADNIIHAIGHAILISKDIYALADAIDYDMERKEVYVSGDVRIYRDDNLLVRTQEARFALDDKYGLIEPFYLQDVASGMWISSKSGESKNEKYTFKQATASSCSLQNPIWRMEASSGTYSNETKYVSFWNPRVYIGDVPILYFPYFSGSTDMSRKSGLLMPYFVSSNTEGLVYSQPYYIAPKSSWDITISPQIRTERGLGGMIEFRALDSKLDRTYAEFGFLHNFDDYIQRFNIRNQNVYGFRIYHLGNRPLQKYFKLQKNLDNGLYINFAHMNDLDYYRLRQVYKRVYDMSYTSKANAFIQTDKHYVGLNFRYFLNLITLDNSSTFQSVPNFQYHKYMDSLFFRHLMYSIDYQFKNTIRQIGYGYIENGLRIPVGLQFSIFKKYLSIGIWNEFYAENLAVTQIENSYIPTSARSGNVFSANYSISLNSDLSRSYNHFFHTIQFEALFNGPYLFYNNGLLSQEVGDIATQIRNQSIDMRNNNPMYNTSQYANKFPIMLPNGSMYFYDDIWDPSGINSYSIINQTLDLKLSQYFFTNDGVSLFDWRIFQRLNFDELNNSTNANPQGIIDSSVIAKRPLENKLSFSPTRHLTLSTSLFYSFYMRRVPEVALTATFKKNYFSSFISYYYKDRQAYDFLTDTILQQVGSNYLRANISHDFRLFAFSASAGYDINSNTLLDWEIGVFKNIRCFGIGLKFSNRRRPMLTNDPQNPLYIHQDFYIRLMLNFSPLTSAGLTTRF